MHWLFSCVLVVVTLAGCGEAQHYVLNGLDNFEPEVREILVKATDDLNERLGRPLIQTEGPGYPINLSVADPEETSILGHATVNFDKCDVLISSSIANKENEDTLVTVFIHELGHCFGLQHTDEQDDLMHTYSRGYSQYSDEAQERFVNQILNSVAIH